MAVGDDGHDFAPVAGIGGVLHEFVVDAREELEILGVIDEQLPGRGDGAGQVLAVGIVKGWLINRVRAHAKRQFATAEQAHAVHDAPVHAEHVIGGRPLHGIGQTENGVGPIRAAAVAQDHGVILVGDQESGHHQDRHHDAEGGNAGGAQAAGGCGEGNGDDHLGQRPEQDGVVHAASGIGGDGHLCPGNRHGQQGKQDGTQRGAAGQGGEQQGQDERAERQGAPGMPGKCRNTGSCGFAVCQSSMLIQPNRAPPSAVAAKRRPLPLRSLVSQEALPRKVASGFSTL